MQTNLENRLFLRFPGIFLERNDLSEKSLMCFGISTGDGWFDLIWDLCTDLEFIANKEGRHMPVAVQVKEKFGGLRFYVHGASKKMFERIHQAETASYRCCETCGELAEVHRSSYGYVHTACTEHKIT